MKSNSFTRLTQVAGRLGTVDPTSRRGTGFSLGKDDQQAPINFDSKPPPTPSTPSDWLICKPHHHYHDMWQVQSRWLFRPDIRSLSTRGKLSRYLHGRVAEPKVDGNQNEESIEEVLSRVSSKDVQNLYSFHLSSTNDFKLIEPDDLISELPANTQRADLLKKLNSSVS